MTDKNNILGGLSQIGAAYQKGRSTGHIQKRRRLPYLFKLLNVLI